MSALGLQRRNLSILGGALPFQGSNLGVSTGAYGTRNSVPYVKTMTNQLLNNRVLAPLLSRPPKQPEPCCLADSADGVPPLSKGRPATLNCDGHEMPFFDEVWPGSGTSAASHPTYPALSGSLFVYAGLRGVVRRRGGDRAIPLLRAE